MLSTEATDEQRKENETIFNFYFVITFAPSDVFTSTSTVCFSETNETQHDGQ